MGKKYKLITRKEHGETVTRIKALRDGEHFIKGEVGGIIDSKSSLSQYDESWVDFESELHASTVSGNLNISKTVLDNAKLTECNGNISNTWLGNVELGFADLSISWAMLKGVRGTHGVILRAYESSIDGKVSMSGKVELSSVKLEQEKYTGGLITFHDISFTKVTMSNPITAIDDFLYNCTLKGPMNLEACNLTNSTVVSEGDETGEPKLQSVTLIGSKIVIPDGKRVMLSNGITIDDVDCADFSKVTISSSPNFVIVRVPDQKWYVWFSVGHGFVDHTYAMQQSYTSETLYRTLEEATGDQLSDAVEVLRSVVFMMRDEPNSDIKSKLKRLRMKLFARSIIRHLGM